MVSTIANRIIAAGWEVVPEGEDPEGKGVKLTPKEMVFITNPKGAKEVLECIEKKTAEKNAAENQINLEAQTEENLTVTTTFTSRLLKAMEENPELQIPRQILRLFYTAFSTLPLESLSFKSLPKDVSKLTGKFGFPEFLQASGVVKNGSNITAGKEASEDEKRVLEFLTSLRPELVKKVAEYLGPRPLKYSIKKPLLEDSLSTPTAAAEEEVEVGKITEDLGSLTVGNTGDPLAARANSAKGPATSTSSTSNKRVSDQNQNEQNKRQRL
jgi:hypothetical protein